MNLKSGELYLASGQKSISLTPDSILSQILHSKRYPCPAEIKLYKFKKNKNQKPKEKE
jgi:hypothetical protein